MLKITLPETETYDPATNTFKVIEKEKTIALEHSLVSLAKWESRYKKPFLSNKPMTAEELLYYIECMTITPNVGPDVFERMTEDNIKEIEEYISDPMTATTFSKTQKAHGREIITAEIIYYWMIALNIPTEYQKWHLNRLMTLIRVCGIKNAPKKKMSKRAAASHQHALNAARRRSLGTSG